MEEQTTQETTNLKPKTFNAGVAYPIETVEDILEDAGRIIGAHGSGKPISKEEIAKILGKSVNTLSLYYSTLQQYGLFSLVHGKGYLPTELYRRYTQPKEDGGEHRTKLEIFRNAPLYSKLIDNLNNHQLPSEEKRFANILKDDPYNVNANSADRAARIFLNNCRDLKILVNNTLKYPIGGEVALAAPPKTNRDGGGGSDQNLSFTLPISLTGDGRQASLTYPKALTKKDIRIIAKALEFIATSISGDEDDEIQIEVKNRKEDRG